MFLNNRRHYAAIILILIFLLLPMKAAFGVGKTESRGLRIPKFRDGVLWFELIADSANIESANNIQDPGKVKLNGVTINIYDPPPSPIPGILREGTRLFKPGEKPFLQYRVTSNEGFYNPKVGTTTLSGDVKLVKYVSVKDGDNLKNVVDATMYCNQAVWVEELSQLTSKGKVTLTRPNGDSLEGEDLVYTMSDNPEEKPSCVQLMKNVSMVIHDMSVNGASAQDNKDLDKDSKQEPTNVSCQGPAWCYLELDEIHFSKEVVVTRQDVRMQSDDLRVVMASGGRVKELHAKGNIRIRGQQAHKGGAKTEYSGSGGHAIYDATENILFLKAEGVKFPEVHFGEYWIRDEIITLDRVAGLITALGKKRNVGHTRLRPLQVNPTADKETPQDINITYGDRLSYDCNGGMARFTGGITLKHPRLSLQSKALDVHTIVNSDKSIDSESSTFQQVRRVVARKKVVIVTNEGRMANAEEAIFDTTAGTLTLTGPPNPTIYEEGRFRINAPRIVSNSALDPGSEGTSFESVKTDGPGEMSIIAVKGEKKLNSDDAGLDTWSADVGTLISYLKEMRYDQKSHQAFFGGNVVLTRGEVVLSSDQLEAHLSEVSLKDKSIGDEAKAEVDEEDLLQGAGLKISKLIARENAVMHSGGRHSRAERMIYDVDQEQVTLIGTENEEAKIWDESGSQLEAQRIVRYNNEYTIDADGPGTLTLSENVPLSNMPRSARIHFGRRLLYIAPPDTPAKAEFIDGVLMRWQDMTVTGDRLETVLSGGTSVAKLLKRKEKLGEDVEPGLLKRRIESAVMTGNVKVAGDKRVATGNEAVLLRNNSSVLLTGKPDAEMRDAEGVRLVAPQFVLLRGLEPKVTATGPGRLYIAAPAAERALNANAGGVWDSRDEEMLPGMHPLDYRLSYKESLVYSMAEKRILFKEKVTIEQSTLFGNCDELEAILANDDSKRSRDSQEQPLTLSSAICTGNVYFERYEPPTEDENLVEILRNLEDNKSRPGSTVLVECEKAVYDVPDKKITFVGEQQPLRILDQEVDRRLNVERRYIYNVTKAIMNTRTGHVSFPLDRIFNRSSKIDNAFPVDVPLRFPPRESEGLTTTP